MVGSRSPISRAVGLALAVLVLLAVSSAVSVTAQRLDALTLFAKIAAREWQ